MDYSEFFHIFYRKRRTGGLKGLTSKAKIVDFFFRNTTDDKGKEILPTSDSSLEKWFDGDPKRKPSVEIWENIVECSKSDNLSVQVLKLLNDNLTREIAMAVEIHLKQDEPLDKRRFARAIVEQFMAIAEGNGEADNIMAEEYAKKPPAVGYDTYLQGAIEKYKWMHILGEEECRLEDYFVCNRISRTSMVFLNHNRTAPIEEATLQKIRTFDPRGETTHVILIGNGGSGKTLMLKHLFLEAAQRHSESSLLPVWIELRNFSDISGEIVSCILRCVNEFDVSFSEAVALELLQKGQFQILMDGLDEMDPSDINNFQLKLSEFVSRYPNNQIVITSREFDGVKSISRFIRLYISPLDNNQSMKLIDNLLIDDSDAVNAKNKILEYMNNGFIKKDGIFASNPMILTYIVRHHEKIEEYSKNKAKFYASIYKSLVEEHDVEKEAFDRIFRSVNNPDEFNDVFAEFCGKSYTRGIFEFDNSIFKNVFRSLKTRESLPNPVKCTMKAFQHDACATACMMYEQDIDIYYIDPGFQEYMFAEYYWNADLKTVREMGRILKNKPISTFRNTDAFDMLFQKVSDKIEIGMYLPYLEEIFKNNSDDEAFRQYILLGYSQISYTVLSHDAIDHVTKETDAELILPAAIVNEPNNMLHYLLLRTLSEQTDIRLLTENNVMCYPGCEVAFFIGFTNDDNGKKTVKLERFTQVQFKIRNDRNLIHYTSNPICSDKSSVSIFGNDYLVDLTEQSSSELTNIIEVINSDAAGVYKTFLKVKAYYKKISKFQEDYQFL